MLCPMRLMYRRFGCSPTSASISLARRSPHLSMPWYVCSPAYVYDAATCIDRSAIEVDQAVRACQVCDVHLCTAHAHAAQEQERTASFWLHADG